MDSRPITISVQGLTKSFYLPSQETKSRHKLQPVRRGRERELRVLDGISFEVHEGEMFGIVGANGSGKTTLMRMLASVYGPDSGSIRIEGKVFLVDMGLGFSSQMSARQNVIQNGVILGVPQRELRRRFDVILDFAGLRDFADVPLMHFSSGMRGRLAFSVMVLADGDVLLMDEIFAVGDAEFREKSLAISHQMIESGKTIVFVTHSMSFIEKNCDRAMLLHHGKIEQMGASSEVCRRYLELNLQTKGERGGKGKGKGHGTGLVAERRDRATISDLRIVGVDGERTATVPEGEAIELRAQLEIRKRVRSPGLRLELRAERGAKLFAPPDAEVEDAVFRPGERVEARAVIANPLTPGVYRLTCLVLGHGPRGPIAASEGATLEFEVMGEKTKGEGLVSLDHQVSFDRERSAELTRT